MELASEMEGLTKNGIGPEDRSSRNSSSGGSSTSEKSRMLDITRDKPIKVAVRVAVPVRDHPKFNFVGKLLGPKGNSMKRLQEDTMCKMAVLGRGSMKDRKKEEELRLSGDPRYSHLSEDLHVEISTFAAPAEAHARIAYALAEVRRFLVPDYHDDIRQEQMWEMQALSTTGTNPDSTNDSIDMLGSDHETNSDISLNNNSILASNCDINNAMQIDVTPSVINGLTNGTNIMSSTGIAALTRLTTTTSSSTPTAATTTTQTTPINNPLMNTMPNEVETQTISLVETTGALLHPALRGVKTVNIAGGLARKRPLLGVPRSSMNPTKRTVMTLLARAKNAQALHNARSGIPHTIGEPLQMITAPMLLQQPLDILQHNGNGTVTSVQKENILQGV